MSTPEKAVGPTGATGPNLLGKPSAELERQMPLRRHVFMSYVNRLKLVPSPPISAMFAAMWGFFGLAGGCGIAGFVANSTTSTVKPGTVGGLWLLTGACALVGLAWGVGGQLLRRTRADQLNQIITEMESMANLYSWEDEETASGMSGERR